jgi:hypothetical protein
MVACHFTTPSISVYKPIRFFERTVTISLINKICDICHNNYTLRYLYARVGVTDKNKLEVFSSKWELSEKNKKRIKINKLEGT